MLSLLTNRKYLQMPISREHDLTRERAQWSGYPNINTYTKSLDELRRSKQTPPSKYEENFPRSSKVPNAQPLSSSERVLKFISSSETKITNPEEIKPYLELYPILASLLTTVHKKLRDKLDKNTVLSLKKYSDPEIDDEYLALYVKPEKYNEQIRQLIDSIYEEHEEGFANSSGILLITVDFSL